MLRYYIFCELFPFGKRNQALIRFGWMFSFWKKWGRTLKETVVLWSGAIKLISLYAFSNDKFVLAQYMIEAIRLHRQEYT